MSDQITFNPADPHRAPYAGVFALMRFPPYVYREYPKWIKLRRQDGSVEELLVHSQAEELATTAEKPIALTQAESERDELALKAVALEDELIALRAQLAATKAPLPTGNPAPATLTLNKPKG